MARNRLYATAWNILNDHDDAEDAVQGTFLSLLARGIDPERAPLQLLLVAVRRRALDMVRQRQTRSELIRSNNYQRPRSIEWDPELIDAKATYARILLLVDVLPERARVVARLHWIDGKTVSAVAALLGVSSKAVEKRLSYARKRIQEGLQSWRERDTNRRQSQVQAAEREPLALVAVAEPKHSLASATSGSARRQ